MNTSLPLACFCKHPLLLALSFAAIPAVAQELSFDMPFAFSAEFNAPLAESHLLIGDDETIAFAAGELGRERIVKAAPYCADAEQESVQPLADGNRIVRKQSTRLCRDGEGRTRQEVDRGGRKIVYLRDPVASENWVLDPQRKTARRLGAQFVPHGPHEHDSSAWREYGEKMREWAKGLHEHARKDAVAPVPPTPADPPVPGVAPLPPVPPAMPVIVVQDERDVRDAQGKVKKEVQVQVLRVQGDHTPSALPMIAPMPPGVALRAQMGAPRGPGVASSLGSKDIEGVKVNGERTTWTIEAGKVGNEKPIVITRDVWTSPDLMLTVQTRDADPRVGETTYRLANLRRGEPDASLMRVPPDYTMSKTPAAPSAPKAPSAPGAKG